MNVEFLKNEKNYIDANIGEIENKIDALSKERDKMQEIADWFHEKEKYFQNIADSFDDEIHKLNKDEEVLLNEYEAIEKKIDLLTA